MARGVNFAGALRVIPGAYSQVNAQNLSAANGQGQTVAIIGQADGGVPGQIYELYTPQDAQAAFRSGNLLDACLMAWAPSPDVGGASKIVAIRAATGCLQGSAILDDNAGGTSPNAIINLKSLDYGAWVNNLRFKIENGTDAATYPGIKRVTVENQLNPGVFEIGDDLGLALTLMYGGAGTNADVTITVVNGVATTLAATCASAAADNFSLDLTKPQFSTLQKVVGYLATLANWTVSLVGDAGMDSGKLDAASSVNVKGTTPIHFPAIINSIVDWFNENSDYIGAAKVADTSSGVPANVAWTNFSNGADGTVDSDAYTTALGLLQSETDVAYVVETTGNVSRQAQVLAHVEDMLRLYKLRQRAFFGPDETVTTVAAANVNAAQLQSERASFYFPGPKRVDSTDTLTTYGGWAAAAMAAGMSVGAHLLTALTNKLIQAGGVQVSLQQGDIEDLLNAGICPIQSVPGRGVRIVQGLTTYIPNPGDDMDFFWTEQSNVDAADSIVGGLEALLEARYVGQFANTTLQQNVLSDTETWLQNFTDKGILTSVTDGTNTSPAFQGITVTIDGGIVNVSYSARIAGSTNYILQTANFVVGG